MIYGLLSGLAVLTLVLVGVTLSAVLDWSAMLRLMPQSLVGAGVAGSVAFSFFPQMVATYREVVDAQAIRGQELKGPRDYLNLGPLLLAGGIERAVTMSELLESRGFGGVPAARKSAFGAIGSGRGARVDLCGGLSLRCWRNPPGALVGALVAGGLLAVALRDGRQNGDAPHAVSRSCSGGAPTRS